MSIVPPQPPAKSIFLSYRRDDSEEVVDRIYDTLSQHFSEEALFRDVDDIEPGANFPAIIRQRLRNCHVVLVFIGRDWLTIEADGRPRLDSPDDHVRQEVQAALALPHARVIPVLVRRAVMPGADQLPAALRPLSDINAMPVRSGRDYRQDVNALVDAVRKGIAESEAQRHAAAEREATRQQAWSAQGAGPLPLPLDEPQWERLLAAVGSGNLVVICGSEFGPDSRNGEPVCREAPIAAQVATALGLPVPPLQARRPLAQLATLCHQAGRRNEFARALRDAAEALAPAASLQALRTIEPLRLFLTCALDRGLEAALAPRAVHPVASLAYTVTDPFGLDSIDLTTVPAMVFHVAGFAGGLEGDAAVTDADWRSFADAWRVRWPEKLTELIEDRDLLVLGGGHPAGFVEFWVELASRLHSGSLWIGYSVFAYNPSLAGFLREGSGPGQTLFDDEGEPAFLAELTLRWLATGTAERPLGPTQLGRPDAQRRGPTGMAASLERSQDASDPLGERPWPGLRAFGEADRSVLHGREREIRQLVRALGAHPVTVLFAASGMGKTSLINAGVVPALRERGVIPVQLRIMWTGADAQPMRVQVVEAVVNAATRAGIALPDAEAMAGLWTFFHHRDMAPSTESGGRSRFALIFDQFEDFFTRPVGSADDERAQGGWRELADLVEGRIPSEVRGLFDRDPTVISEYSVRAPAPPILFSLREDFLPAMTALSGDMPSLTRSNVRIRGLSHAQAKDVVLKAGPGIFTEEAAEALIRSLETGASDAEGAPRSMVDSSVLNPAMLALICHALNEDRLARGLAHVDAGLVDETRDRVLESYYENAFTGLSPALRIWVEDELITPSGRRDSLSLERAEHGLIDRGLPPTSTHVLVGRRLLSISAEGGIPRIQLAHDLLLPMARKSRDARTRPDTTL